MSFTWINKIYNLNIKRGTKVTYTPEKEGREPKRGKVTSANRGYIKIRFDGDLKTYPVEFHPTWNIAYHQQ